MPPLGQLLCATCNADRVNACKLNEEVGFFWDADVLKNQANLEDACKTHHAFLMGVITQGFAKSTRAEFSDAVDEMNRINDGKLMVKSMNKIEWLRQEGHVCKQLMIHIRNKEYYSIDFSRSPAWMQSLLKAYRECKDHQGTNGNTKDKVNKGDQSVKKRQTSNVYELMGVTPPHAKKGKHDLVLIEDSPISILDDEVPSSTGASSSTAQERFYMDIANMKPMRLFPSGAVQVGLLKAGPAGFAKGVWEDGKEWTTEVPNLALEKPIQSVMKRPAGKSLWEQIDSEDENDNEEETIELVFKRPAMKPLWGERLQEEQEEEQTEEQEEKEEQEEEETEEQEQEEEQGQVQENGEEEDEGPELNEPEDEEDFPSFIRIGILKLQFTYAQKQSYIHVKFDDGTKKFLLNIGQSKTANHKREILKIGQELSKQIDRLDDCDKIKKKALDIRKQNWGY